MVVEMSSIHHDVTAVTLIVSRGGQWTWVAALIVLVAVTIFASKSRESRRKIHGIPEFGSIPMLGGSFVYLTQGMPGLLRGLIATGKDGISYTDMMGNRVVSVHQDALTREVLSLPEEIASRYLTPVHISAACL